MIDASKERFIELGKDVEEIIIWESRKRTAGPAIASVRLPKLKYGGYLLEIARRSKKERKE